MDRDQSLNTVQERSKPFDIIVIGGGATGVGVAMDAAVRGLSVLLLEQSDFGKGTSSRSTKLIHGGVRYLKQGNISLVRDSLRERARLRKNAPHLVHDMPFMVPCESIWQKFMYRIGFVFLRSGELLKSHPHLMVRPTIRPNPLIKERPAFKNYRQAYSRLTRPIGPSKTRSIG